MISVSDDRGSEMRNRKYGQASAGLIVTGLTLATVLIQPAPAASASTARPQWTPCTPSQKFKVATTRYTKLGNPKSNSWTWAYNKSGTKASLSLSFGTNSQVGYSIQATQSVEAGVIFASASASLSEGISYTHTDNYSRTISVTIPGHRYGEAGVANIYAIVTGTYMVTYENCKTATVKHVIARFPTTDPTGFIDDTTARLPVKPPWPLAPR
jgi:hypothetical protein